MKLKICGLSIYEFRSVLTISVLTIFEWSSTQSLCGQGPGRVGVAGAWEYPRRATDRPGTLWGLGNFRISFSGHGFQDLGSQLWGLGNFRIWFSGHGFRDLGSQLWGLRNFRIWFSGHDFRTWDLNFGAWIFTLAVSKTET